MLPRKYTEIMEKADLGKFKEDTDIGLLTKMIDYTMSGLMREQFLNDFFQPEIYFGEIKHYLEMVKKLSYK